MNEATKKLPAPEVIVASGTNEPPNGGGFARKAGPGRPAGIPNKTTSALRSMLTMLAEFNVGHVQKALDDVRDGKLAPVISKKTGMPVIDPVSGLVVLDYIVAPDPGKFADLYIKLVEFAAPKLQRSEVVTRDGGADIEPIAASATQDEAQRAYIKMVQG